MRAGSADRDRTVDVLRAAYVEGRLTKEEFDTRSAQVMAAKTYADLAEVVADLPSGPAGPVSPFPAPGGFPAPNGYYPAAPVPPTSGLAIAALVCGLAEIPTAGLASVPAIILGHLARDHIRHTGERGDSMAVAGLVLGYMGVIFWVLVFLFIAGHS